MLILLGQAGPRALCRRRGWSRPHTRKAVSNWWQLRTPPPSSADAELQPATGVADPQTPQADIGSILLSERRQRLFVSVPRRCPDAPVLSAARHRHGRL